MFYVFWIVVSDSLFFCISTISGICCKITDKVFFRGGFFVVKVVKGGVVAVASLVSFGNTCLKSSATTPIALSVYLIIILLMRRPLSSVVRRMIVPFAAGDTRTP